MDDNFVSRGDFKEQREKLVSLLFYTTETVEEKTKSVYIFHAVSNSRVHCVSLKIPCKYN